ncbi:MAG: hypothetical protein WCL02_05150 [bacterium]
MQPLQRYVEQQDPLLIYTILTKVMRNQQINIDMLLQSFDTKGTLYTTIQESTNSK